MPDAELRRNSQKDESTGTPVMTSHHIEPTFVHCPFCGEEVELLIDTSVTHQRYIEDCEVCCRPMEISASVWDGVVSVEVRGEE